MLTKEGLIEQIKEYNRTNPAFRWGQAVFNYIDQYYGVARDIQFIDHIDCFYFDENVDDFINHALYRIQAKEMEKK